MQPKSVARPKSEIKQIPQNPLCDLSFQGEFFLTSVLEWYNLFFYAAQPVLVYFGKFYSFIDFQYDLVSFGSIAHL